MKIKKLKHLFGILAVAIITVVSVHQLEPWQRPLLSGDLDINLVDFNDVVTAEFANPSGTLTIYKPGVYPIESVYLTFNNSDPGFISGEALKNSPLSITLNGANNNEAYASNKNIIINTVPFTTFSVDISYNGVKKNFQILFVQSGQLCTDSFISVIEPNGGNLNLYDTNLGSPGEAVIENADLIPGNTFRFIADQNLIPPGASPFTTEVRLVNSPNVLNQKANILQQNNEEVILEVGAIQGDLASTKSNLVYAFNQLAESMTYLDAVVGQNGLRLFSEEFGQHTEDYVCQLNDEVYLGGNLNHCFEGGVDGDYGVSPVKKVDGPLETGKTYPITVNTQGGAYTWKVNNESIATITPFSEVEDDDVNATVDYIPSPLTSDPQVSIPFGQFTLSNCVLDENNIKTECNLQVSLAVEYDDDGSHEASVTADGEALENVSLSSNGFSGTLTGTTKVYRNDAFNINLSGKASGNFVFTVNQGVYSGGGGGPVESAITASVNGNLTEITEANIKTQFSLDLNDPAAFTEGNLVKTGEFTINLTKTQQGGSTSIALLNTLTPGTITVFAEENENQCLLAKNFQVVEPESPFELDVNLKRIGSVDILKGSLLNFWSKLITNEPVTLADVTLFLVKPSSNAFNTVEEIDGDGSAVWHELFVFLQQVKKVDEGQNQPSEQEGVEEQNNEQNQNQENNPQQTEQNNLLENFVTYSIPFQIPNGGNIFNGNYYLYFLLTVVDAENKSHEKKVIYPVYIGPQSNSDVNKDGLLNIVDLILIFQISTGNLIPTAEQMAAADVNKDGQVTVIDVILAYQKIFKS